MASIRCDTRFPTWGLSAGIPLEAVSEGLRDYAFSRRVYAK